MKRIVTCLSVLALSAVIAATSFAQDAPKKKKNADGAGKGGAGQSALAQAMKVLEPANLTDDQKGKVKALAAKLQETTKALKAEGLTAELTKKRMAAMKAAREAGSKGKDLAAAANEGLSAEEIAVLAKAAEAESKFHKEVFALLSAEQKAALPENAQKSWAGERTGKGKGKKKKGAE